MLKILIGNIVKAIMSYIRSFMFNYKLKSTNKKIKKAKKELQNAGKISEVDFSVFSDLYKQYNVSQSELRSGSETVCEDGGESECDNKEADGGDK